MEFRALVENQNNKKIKVLRNDNGKEFNQKVFDEFCRQHGIDRHDITPYLNQQNGVVERMNKTSMEKPRSMLSDTCLSQDYQEEIVDMTCYLVNRLSTLVLVKKTPYNAWVVELPSLSHLKAFGCDSFMHIPQEGRKKLDSKSEKCIFMRYKHGIKGYKLIEYRYKDYSLWHICDIQMRQDYFQE